VTDRDLIAALYGAVLDREQLIVDTLLNIDVAATSVREAVAGLLDLADSLEPEGAVRVRALAAGVERVVDALQEAAERRARALVEERAG
jgi:hypothetical protein